MLMRKRCLPTTCVVISLLVLFFINILLYFLVDSGIILNIVYDPVKKNVEKVPDVITAQAVIPKKSEKPNNVKPISKVVKQKFLPWPEGRILPASSQAEKRILAAVADVAEKYKNATETYMSLIQAVLKDLKSKQEHFGQLSIADKWVTGREVVSPSSAQLGAVLNKLCSSKILKADNSKKGTQLKISLTLEGGYKALFKPKWYERSTVIPGPVYAGKDRHNGEVAAFHLSLLLGLRRVPLTVGRKIDLRREVMPVATQALRSTFFQEGNNTCFYGVCYYCSPEDPVCAERDLMEGALILWLSEKMIFARYAHPWQRSYRRNFAARWEVEEDYCLKIKKAGPYALNTSERILDLVDTAIFDFLVDNGDRHHYEAPINAKPSAIFLFDNGKSFGNPSEDHLDILAPLYQCCVIRRRTWLSLVAFQGNVLGSSLEEIMLSSHIAPVLVPSHLKALDRRLLMVFATVEVCLRDNPHNSVML